MATISSDASSSSTIASSAPCSLPFDPEIDLRIYLPHDTAGSRITAYLALPEAVREAEGLADVQFRLEPRYPAFYERAAASSDVVALRRLLGRAEADPDVWVDLAQVADDLTSWRRFVSFGAPLPVPIPDAADALLDATPRASLIPEVFGDIATLTYGDSFGRIPVSAVDIITRIDPVPTPTLASASGRRETRSGFRGRNLTGSSHRLTARASCALWSFSA